MFRSTCTSPGSFSGLLHHRNHVSHSKIGARTFFILLVSGQILNGDHRKHFGILEFPKDPISLKKTLGAVLGNRRGGSVPCARTGQPGLLLG